LCVNAPGAINSARLVFTVGFMRARSSLITQARVKSTSLRCSVTTSLAAKEFVRDGGKSCRICRIQAHLTPMNQHLHRKARPNPATSWPMRPKPQTPRVFPAIDSPKQASGHSGNDGTLRCHWPAYKFTVYDGKRRNAASTNSQVNSAVACE